MDIQDTDIPKLPRVSFIDVDLLPSKPGLYFVLTSEVRLLYIGKTKDFRNRWLQHHQESRLAKAQAAWVAYQIVADERERDILEGMLINLLKPHHNIFETEAESDEDRAARLALRAQHRRSRIKPKANNLKRHGRPATDLRHIGGYFTDEEAAEIQARADRVKLTTSNLFRLALGFPATKRGAREGNRNAVKKGNGHERQIQ